MKKKQKIELKPERILFLREKAKSIQHLFSQPPLLSDMMRWSKVKLNKKRMRKKFLGANVFRMVPIWVSCAYLLAIKQYCTNHPETAYFK